MNGNLIGQTLLNQFRVDEFIASGGMATVYRVWDIKRNAPLAMKVLHADLADDPSVLKRFRREAHALRKLAHPNIVPFYGLYQADDFSFLLEGYVNGPTLKSILRQQQGNPLPLAETLPIMKALCSALGYAHANGVVHCDVKPGNVMVDPGGTVFLTDFGIARHAESSTTTIGIAGTPAYMAPEQIRGAPVTPATDVYALGAMLFEMLTGQRPFQGGTRSPGGSGPIQEERIRSAHLAQAPPDPQSINPKIPSDLAKVILKAMEIHSSRRFQDTMSLFSAICAALMVAPENVSGWLVKYASAEPGTIVGVDSPIDGEIPFEIRKRPNPRSGIYLVIIVAIVLLGAVLLLRGGPPSDGTVPYTTQSQAVIAGISAKASPTNASPPTVEQVLVNTHFQETMMPTLTQIAPTQTQSPVQPQLTAEDIVPPTSQNQNPDQATPEPMFYNFYACGDPCNGNPTLAVQQFPKKTKFIYLNWTYENVPTGANYARVWSVDGREWVRYDCSWNGPSNGQESDLKLWDMQGLTSGTWTLSIFINGWNVFQESLKVLGNWNIWTPAGTFNACYGSR